MRITGLYVALAALLILILSIRVTLRRRKLGIGLGDGGDDGLRKLVRAQANAIEYLPIALLCLLLLELNATAALLLHVFGCVLIAGRCLHAFALSRSSGASGGRVIGMSLTWLALLAMAVLLLWQWLAWAMISAVH